MTKSPGIKQRLLMATTPADELQAIAGELRGYDQASKKTKNKCGRIIARRMKELQP